MCLYYSIQNADAHIECVNSIILNTEQKIKGHEEKHRQQTCLYAQLAV